MFLGGLGFIKVTHQANAYAGPVLDFTFEMAAIELLFPSVPNGDFAVWDAMAISDDKMISQPVFHAAAAMGAVHAFDRADGGGTVMDDNGFPAGRSLDLGEIFR